jgi:hypothetical protein
MAKWELYDYEEDVNINARRKYSHRPRRSGQKKRRGWILPWRAARHDTYFFHLLLPAAMRRFSSSNQFWTTTI